MGERWEKKLAARFGSSKQSSGAMFLIRAEKKKGKVQRRVEKKKKPKMRGKTRTRGGMEKKAFGLHFLIKEGFSERDW